MSATATEIAALRRRYLLMATSIFVLDLAITLIFSALSGAWANSWRTIGAGVILLLAFNWTISSRLFAPIQDYLEGKTSFDSIQRRLTQLPILSAAGVGIMAFIVWSFRLSTPWWIETSQLPPTIADFIVADLVLTVFYFTFTYFVISDYLATLCGFIFDRYGENLGLFFGSYRQKLMVALLVISITPLAAIMAELYSYEGERLHSEILVDVATAALGVALSAYFIVRSFLRPLRILSDGMEEVASGNLEVRVAVTSNDEAGEVTTRFNAMVEGLRERERIRETFGRYVDESVAATILARRGDASGEVAEATILFTDIAGFTTIAEYLSPSELVAVLNEYLGTVLEPIRRNGGVVNTFIGDGLFASFNMPLACPDHACAAVQAAIDIQRAVGSRTFGDFGVALATRIGISSGPVIGGSVGAGQRMSYTLLGDTVNLAARLEVLNKELGTRILVSQSTRDACGERFAFTPLGTVGVRGRSEQIAIFTPDPNLQETAS
ncbi:adenylate/guanylate cyclase domain-containing protein [Reyranella sp.]|uniref:adenylate/guanylate cyclase domain-containing protein n=1 Tax=Reyranella sp. TaxID=1929291 RepID=UPI003D103E39